MANTANTGMNKSELIKFVQDEISNTETALGFVVASLEDKSSTQYNYVYSRKKFEYEGALSSLYAVLEAAGVVVPEAVTDAEGDPA